MEEKPKKLERVRFEVKETKEFQILLTCLSPPDEKQKKPKSEVKKYPNSKVFVCQFHFTGFTIARLVKARFGRKDPHERDDKDIFLNKALGPLEVKILLKLSSFALMFFSNFFELIDSKFPLYKWHGWEWSKWCFQTERYWGEKECSLIERDEKMI